MSVCWAGIFPGYCCNHICWVLGTEAPVPGCGLVNHRSDVEIATTSADPTTSSADTTPSPDAASQERSLGVSCGGKDMSICWAGIIPGFCCNHTCWVLGTKDQPLPYCWEGRSLGTTRADPTTSSDTTPSPDAAFGEAMEVVEHQALLQQAPLTDLSAIAKDGTLEFTTWSRHELSSGVQKDDMWFTIPEDFTANMK